MKRPAILHTPIDIGGHAAGLAAAQRRLGLNAVCVTLYPAPHSTAEVRELCPPDSSPAFRERMRWHLFRRALREFDVIHFYFGETLLMPRRRPDLRDGKRIGATELLRRLYARVIWGADLPALRMMGKRIVFSFLGDDVRRRDYSLANFDTSIAHEVGDDYYPPHSDHWKRKLVRLADRYADAILAYNPDLLHVLPARARFIAYTHLFPGTVHPAPRDQTMPLRIAHAPTSRAAKGTAHVVDAVATLRREGLPIVLDLIEGCTHQESMRRIGESHLFVDQLLSGWYGGAALEAMLSGVPVAAYIREGDLAFLPAPMREQLPILRTSPHCIAATLRETLAAGPDRLAEIGRRSREYALRHHDPVTIARDLSSTLDFLAPE